MQNNIHGYDTAHSAGRSENFLFRRIGRLGKYVLSGAILSVAPLLLRAQEESPVQRFQVGVIGAGTLNMHQGDFTTYDGILECGTFDKATTPGWQAGNIVDIPLSPLTAISARIFYYKADGEFTTPNPISPNVELQDGTLVRLQTEHTLATSLDYVMADILGKWRVLEPVYIGAGPSVGLSTRAAYEQEEMIIGPKGMTFTNGQSTRKIIAGNFDQQGTRNTQRNLRIGVTGVIGADIPLTENLVLNPEAGYTFGVTNVLSGFDWKVNTLRAGIALKYAFGGEQAPATPQPPVTPEPPAPKPQPVVLLDVQNRLDDGTRLNYAEITITEERSLDVVPLLPYVFFAPNSSELQSRYRRLSGAETVGFNESALQDSTLGIYYNVLNIIGNRMRSYPEATITITGCREPLDDTGNEAALASSRAATVKQYLVSTWNIEPSRIRTESRVLPQAISNRQVNDGREENRRAEIASSDARILAPVQREYIQREVQPAAVVLVPKIQFGESLISWNSALSDEQNRTLWEQQGAGSPSDDLVWNIDKNAVAGQTKMVRGTTTLTALLNTLDDEGHILSASREIPVRKIIRGRRFNGEVVRDSVLERYALMFFDFDTPKISDFNTQVMQLIQSRMRISSSVRITGLTDRIGSEEYNKTLSLQRAQAIGQGIRSRIVPEVLTTTGAGELLIYNNDLPEGRFYNRTVIVEIATPIAE
jgi:outer membrane protein OmpA-like peptidoglycan-associated protein